MKLGKSLKRPIIENMLRSIRSKQANIVYTVVSEEIFSMVLTSVRLETSLI